MARRTICLNLLVALVAVCGASRVLADSEDALHQRKLTGWQDKLKQLQQGNVNWNNWQQKQQQNGWEPGAWGQQTKPQFCKAYQWLCKAVCKTSCCNLQLSQLGSSPKCFCSQGEAESSGKAYTFCCDSSGPITDPIFTDFQNRTFEFMGEADKIYNVITHPSSVVNMRLAPAGEGHVREQHGPGTFTDILAFKFGETNVLVEASEDGQMAVSVDDEDQDTDKFFTAQTKNVNISFDPFFPNSGERLVLSSDLFVFTITARPAYMDRYSGYNRGHLDLETQINAFPGKIDGVLGHSIFVKPEDLLRPAEQRAFHNSEKDYLVKDLFAGLELPKDSSRRRSLIEASSLHFPMSASVTLNDH